ncbi:MAG: NAD kinase [Bacteroidetes bacterium]|nr:NAD kinase [Bacteroidota bacterium]MBL7103539.1 NAD kinase [Bacteroidales bacterium]
MNIAIFGKSFSEENKGCIQQLIDKLESRDISLLFYEPFYKELKDNISLKQETQVFTRHDEIIGKVDFLFSIGGDGTLLNTITLVRDSGIPILGINLGRMGFLSSISKEKIDSAIEQLLNRRFKLDQRTLLRLETPNNIFGDLNYALNEMAVYKKYPFSMLRIQAYVNNEYLNSYWADGLIVATPTGSTAYSLSSGGPIVLPRSQNFLITPIATHNLTVRPIVIPDSSQIKIKVVGRTKEFFVGLDSRSEIVDSSVELTVKKEEFRLNLMQLAGESYFKTIREKLMWGLDVRN